MSVLRSKAFPLSRADFNIPAVSEQPVPTVSFRSEQT